MVNRDCDQHQQRQAASNGPIAGEVVPPFHPSFGQLRRWHTGLVDDRFRQALRLGDPVQKGLAAGAVADNHTVGDMHDFLKVPKRDFSHLRLEQALPIEKPQIREHGLVPMVQKAGPCNHKD